MSDIKYSVLGLLLTWPVLHVLFICPFWSGLHSSINLAWVFLTEAQANGDIPQWVMGKKSNQCGSIFR